MNGRIILAAALLTLSACAATEDAPKPMAQNMGELTDVTLYVNLGDSVAAGLWADPDKSYPELLFTNHPDYPGYEGHDIGTWYEGAEYYDGSIPGAESEDVLEQQLRNLPASSGDTVVTIYIGGNDITANPYNLFTDDGIQTVIDGYVEHMGGVLDALEKKYQGPGRNVAIALATVHDPTDDQGSIPAEFTGGFCGTIAQIPPDLYDEALANMGRYNDAIRAFAAERKALVMDSYALVQGHGMNAPDGQRWLSDDCIHFNNEGHHQLRRGYWESLTGEVF